MISEEDVEKALDYLRDSAELAAQAQALEAYLNEFRKVLKAELEKECNDKTEASKERFAYAHEQMKVHLEGYREAVYQAKKHKFLREAAVAKIEAWRTQEANYRGMGKVG